MDKKKVVLDLIKEVKNTQIKMVNHNFDMYQYKKSLHLLNCVKEIIEGVVFIENEEDS